MPIYIADGDPAVLVVLRFLLESEGYTVSAFRSGADEVARTCSPPSRALSQAA